MPQILRFLAPVLFIPLIDPLVSVVEAGLIGNFASTTEMAGMAPASLIFLFCVYAFNGLGVQALGDVSRYMSKGKINEGELPMMRVQGSSGMVLTVLTLAHSLLSQHAHSIRSQHARLPSDHTLMVLSVLSPSPRGPPFGMPAASETVSTALVMGATWGLAMAVCLELFGPSILGMLCTCPEVLAHATDFLR